MRVTARGVRTLLIASMAAVASVASTAATGSVQVPPPPPPPPPAVQSGQMPAQSPTPDPPKGTGILMGQIIDATTRRPVAGATVIVSGGATTSITLPTGEIVSSTGAVAAGDAPRQILTNSEGQFLFRALAAGRYSIRASAPGYLSSAFGQSRPAGSSQSIELTRDDEKRADLMVRMWKSGSISGRIVDEAGEPVVDLSVRVYRRDFVSGRQRLVNASSAYTDDRGVYRAVGLSPGEYVVGISSTQATMPVATAEAYYQEMVTAGGSLSDRAVYNSLSSSGASLVTSGYRVGDFLISAQGSGRGIASGPALPPVADGKLAVYARQYFPTAATIPQASTITLASGEDRVGIDLQLKLVPTARVSGTLIGPDGPAANLGLRLTPIDAEGLSFSPITSDGASTATDGSGAFTFLGVTPGQYTLTCLKVPRAQVTSTPSSMIEITGPNGMILGMSSGGAPSIPPALPADPSLYVSMPVTVTESDIHGLSVTLRPGIRLSGKLVFEGTKDQPIADQLLRTSIQINPVNGNNFVTPLPAKKVEADGRFATMGFPPGRYTISASLPVMQGGVSGWRFKSTTLGGTNVDDGFEISDRDLSTLVITFTDRSTELSGTVTDANGQPDKFANVITIPADAQGWKQGNINSRRVRSTRTTTTGAYQIVDLPAGEYFIAAISDEELQNWQDPKTLEAITRVATHITLGEGEKRAESLKTRSIR